MHFIKNILVPQTHRLGYALYICWGTNGGLCESDPWETPWERYSWKQTLLLPYIGLKNPVSHSTAMVLVLLLCLCLHFSRLNEGKYSLYQPSHRCMWFLQPSIIFGAGTLGPCHSQSGYGLGTVWVGRESSLSSCHVGDHELNAVTQSISSFSQQPKDKGTV